MISRSKCRPANSPSKLTNPAIVPPCLNPPSQSAIASYFCTRAGKAAMDQRVNEPSFKDDDLFVAVGHTRSLIEPLFYVAEMFAQSKCCRSIRPAIVKAHKRRLASRKPPGTGNAAMVKGWQQKTGWEKTWTVLSHNISTCLLGIVFSWLLFVYSNYNAGYNSGLRKGLNQEQTTFSNNLPNLIEQSTPGYIDGQKRIAYDDGYKKGTSDAEAAAKRALPDKLMNARNDGYNAGFAAGAAAGKNEGALQTQISDTKQCGLMLAAPSNWANYRALVLKAAQLIKQSRSKNFDETNLPPVLAMVELAETLKRAYSNQASSFDSIMDELADAMKEKDFKTAAPLILAIAEALPGKGRIYLDNEKIIDTAFTTVAEDSKP
jgi:hypothetical protein